MYFGVCGDILSGCFCFCFVFGNVVHEILILLSNCFLCFDLVVCEDPKTLLPTLASNSQHAPIFHYDSIITIAANEMKFKTVKEIEIYSS